MKIITPLLLSGLCFAGYVTAQPVISSDVFGTAGESYIMKGVEEAGFDPGDGGAGMTWDFSSNELNGGTDVRTVIDASTSTYGADFPDANIATVVNDTSFTYYFISDAILSYYGTATPTITQIFDEPADLIDFPVTYNDAKTDDFSGFTSILGYDVTLTGTSTMTADGYGTIILPAGGATYSDVLRIRLELNILGEVSGLPITAEINSTIYYWLMNGITGPVMQFTSAETAISGFPTTPAIFIDVNSDLLADVSEVTPVFLTVYPTLADDVVTVKSENGGKVTLYSISGQKILSQEAASNHSIDISQLAAGNYLILLQTENGPASKMISVTH
jgi:hypothetical protein